METVALLLCLLLSAFFSGMEIAFVSSNKIFIGIERMQDSLASRMLARISAHPNRFIVAMLLGNTLSLVLYVYLSGPYMQRVSDVVGLGERGLWALLFQAALSTGIILVASEFLPKVFFRMYANQMVKALAIPAGVIYIGLERVALGILRLADFVLVRVLRSAGDREKAFFTRAELGEYIAEQLNTADETAVDMEVQIFRNALEFSGVKARDIMTPRTEIAAIGIDEPIADLCDMFVATGYSKIMVYDGSNENIIGYVHSFELFRKPQTIRSVMIAIEFVPEGLLIKDILNQLTRKRRSVAVVLDEHGGVSGIVTVEDIVEELFGEIEDEHDSDGDHTEEQLSEGHWRFAARLEVAYVNEKYGLGLPDHSAYSTLGGLMVFHAGDIPEAGAQIAVGDYLFTVEACAGKRIELLSVRRVD